MNKQYTVVQFSLECIPVQSPPVHTLSSVLSCSLRSSEVQTGILPLPHCRHHHCHQRWGWPIAACSAATGGNVQYSSPDGPEGEQTLFKAVINTKKTESQKCNNAERVPVAPGGRFGLPEL